MPSGTEEHSTSGPVSVALLLENIPGADIRDPYKSHAVPVLRWRLLCSGIKAPSCQKKGPTDQSVRVTFSDSITY